ncbi:unnamed protein product [Ectocarpus sp. 6 AP-2014]
MQTKPYCVRQGHHFLPLSAHYSNFFFNFCQPHRLMRTPSYTNGFANFNHNRQKRGLPHSHITFQVCDEHKPDNAVCIDKHIRATWPHREQEPALHDTFNKFMTHKNCKSQHRRRYVEGRKQCKKRFPEATSTYHRFRREGLSLSFAPSIRRRQDIVPYNDTLFLVLDAHINVPSFGNRQFAIRAPAPTWGGGALQSPSTEHAYRG